MDGSSLQCASLHTQGAFLSGGILTYGKMEGCEERSVLGSNRLKVLNLGYCLKCVFIISIYKLSFFFGPKYFIATSGW